MFQYSLLVYEYIVAAVQF